MSEMYLVASLAYAAPSLSCSVFYSFYPFVFKFTCAHLGLCLYFAVIVYLAQLIVKRPYVLIICNSQILKKAQKLS